MVKPTLVLAAGGTGGHIFPAEALAAELTARGYKVLLLTDKRFAQYAANMQSLESRTICSASFAGGVVKKLLAVLQIMVGVIQAWLALGASRPASVVGFGGYPTFPVLYAAWLRRIPIVLHEQNSLLGSANAAFAHKAALIATSFAEVSGIPAAAKRKIKQVGNPVRPAIIALGDVAYPPLSDTSTVNILVTGGSQGARIMAEVVPQAIALLPQELRSRLRVDQQCHADAIPGVRQLYSEAGVSTDILPFFTDMPIRLARAHLVICRSGASSIAEIAVAGRPAIMVPLPTAKDNHQLVNAKAVADVGGGWIVTQDVFTPESLKMLLHGLLADAKQLSDAAGNVRKIAHINAGKALADCVETVINKR